MKRMTAVRRVERALAKGTLTRATACQLCDRTEPEIRSYIEQRRGACKQTRSVIQAHHHNGYDNPLDVWWICTECNGMLWHRHDGSMALAEARDTAAKRHLKQPIQLAGGRVFTAHNVNVP
jgi:hypothetical protein